MPDFSGVVLQVTSLFRASSTSAWVFQNQWVHWRENHFSPVSPLASRRRARSSSSSCSKRFVNSPEQNPCALPVGCFLILLSVEPRGRKHAFPPIFSHPPPGK